MRSAKSTFPSFPLAATPLAGTADTAAPPRSLAAPVLHAPLRVPRGISRVPTHAVGRARERRAYARARLSLPLRVIRIAGQRSAKTQPLRTEDISSSGIFFHYPHTVEPGTPIEVEVLLVDRPLGRGSVRMCTLAHVVRSHSVAKSGWHGLAAVFDDIRYVRDDAISTS